MGVAGWAGRCQEQGEVPGWLFSVGGWIEGCVDTVQGCCGDNQEVWLPQGSPSTLWWARDDTKGAKSPFWGCLEARTISPQCSVAALG